MATAATGSGCSGREARLGGAAQTYERRVLAPDAEVVIDTAELSPEEAAQEVLLHLEHEGFLAPAAG